MPVSQRAEGKKCEHRRRPPHGAGPRTIPSTPPVAALADEGALGVKACGRVPVAQLDSSSGFLIRRSQVRVLPGTPSYAGPFRTHGLRFIPETWVTLLPCPC